MTNPVVDYELKFSKTVPLNSFTSYRIVEKKTVRKSELFGSVELNDELWGALVQHVKDLGFEYTITRIECNLLAQNH